MTGEGAILQGDNNDTPDPSPVTAEQVMGTPRYVFTDELGTLYRATQHPLIRIPLAALALVGLLAVRPRRKHSEATTAARDDASPKTAPADVA